MNLCIQISRFPLSGSQGALRAERILQNTFKARQSSKSTDIISSSMSLHSRTTSSGLLQEVSFLQYSVDA